MQAADEHPVDELVGRPGGDLAGERKNEHIIDAGVGEQLTALIDAGELLRSVLRPKYGDGVRIEGDRHQRQASGVCELAAALHHVLVAEMDAVEVPDHDDGTTEVVSNLIERTPHTHEGQ